MAKRKIGLVGWTGGGQNYGTTLQAFALFCKIRQKGYDVCYVRFPHSIPRLIGSRLKRFLVKSGLMSSSQNGVSHMGNHPEKLQKNRAFVLRHLKYSPRFFVTSGFERFVKTLSCVITGSDQIWNPYHLNPDYLLCSIPKDVKRISYSSSIGIEKLPVSRQALYKETLGAFSHLSLREFSGVRLVSDLLDRKDIVKVLDPVFLLDSDDWDRVIASDAPRVVEPKTPYVLCYFVGDNAWYKTDVDRILQQSGYQGEVRIVPLEASHYQTGYTLCETAGVGEFIRLVKEADLLITDSFHATVLSIIYRKTFVEFLRFKETEKVSQNSRLTELLDRYGLQEQWYRHDPGRDWFSGIDYCPVYEILEKDKELSESYLWNAIEN